MFQCVPLKQFIKIMLVVIIMNYCSHKVKNELGHLLLVMTVQKNDVQMQGFWTLSSNDFLIFVVPLFSID